MSKPVRNILTIMVLAAYNCTLTSEEIVYQIYSETIHQGIRARISIEIKSSLIVSIDLFDDWLLTQSSPNGPHILCLMVETVTQAKHFNYSIVLTFVVLGLESLLSEAHLRIVRRSSHRKGVSHEPAQAVSSTISTEPTINRGRDDRD